MFEFTFEASGTRLQDVAAARAFPKQAIPDLNDGLSDPNVHTKAPVQLGKPLGGAVLMRHSSVGLLPVSAKALALLEPGAVVRTS